MGRFAGDILDHTFPSGVRVVKTTSTLPRNPGTVLLVRQGIAAGTSVGANVREANHIETRKAFVPRVAAAVEECRAAIRRLGVIVAAGIVPRGRMNGLIQEGREIETTRAMIVRRSKRKLTA